MSAKPATPLPWETMIPQGRSIWSQQDARIICDIKDYPDGGEKAEREDAAYIVAAANAYPALVAALWEVIAECEFHGAGNSTSANKARALLRSLGEL